MHTYKDKTGREWKIDLSLQDVVDLEAIDYTPVCSFVPKFRTPDVDTLRSILEQPLLAGVIGWYFARKQVIEETILIPDGEPVAPEGQPKMKRMEDKDYYRLFGTAELTALKEAIVKEYGNFFQMAPTSIQKLIETSSNLRRIGAEELEKAISEEFSEDKMRQMIQKEVNNLVKEAQRQTEIPA